MPADAVPGSTIPEDSEAEILLRDGTWAWAQVIGQRKDRHGRWCVGLRWYASPAVGGREGWYLYDSAFIRRPNPALVHLVLARRVRQLDEAARRTSKPVALARDSAPPDLRILAGKTLCSFLLAFCHDAHRRGGPRGGVGRCGESSTVSGAGTSAAACTAGSCRITSPRGRTYH